jgi:hypothetical protein
VVRPATSQSTQPQKKCSKPSCAPTTTPSGCC